MVSILLHGINAFGEIMAIFFFILSALYVYRIVQTHRSSLPRWLPYQHAFFYCFGMMWLNITPFIRKSVWEFLSDGVNNEADFAIFFKRMAKYEILFKVLSAFFYSMAYIGYFCLVATLLRIHGAQQDAAMAEISRSRLFQQQQQQKQQQVVVERQDTTLEISAPSSVLYPKHHFLRQRILFVLSKVHWFMVPVPVFTLIALSVQRIYGIKLLIDCYILLWTLIFTAITGLFLTQVVAVKGAHALSILMSSILMQLVIAISVVVHMSIQLSSHSWPEFSIHRFAPWLVLLSILVLSFDSRVTFLELDDKKAEIEVEGESIPVRTIVEDEPEQAAGVN